MRLLIKVLFTFLFVSQVVASEINLRRVEVSCGKTTECKELKENFKSLRRSYTNIEHLKSILKLYVINEGIKNFNYEIYKRNQNFSLKINLIPKKRVASISVQVIGKDMGYPSILPIKESDFLDIQKISRTKKLLRDLYLNKGFPDVVVDFKELKRLKEGGDISFVIKAGKPIKVNKVEIITNSSYQKEILNRKLSSFKNQPFDIQEIKNVVEDVRVVFLNYGYYLVQMNLKYELLPNKKVDLFVELKSGGLHQFDVRVLDSEEKVISYKDLLSEAVITYRRTLSEKVVLQILGEHLIRQGYLHSSIKVNEKTYINSMGDAIHLYKVDITKGDRSYVKNIEFRGNNVLSEKQLLRLYYENAYEQASRNIYDENYYKNFQELIRQEYIKRGYVNIFVDKPEIKIMPKSKHVKVVFRVREGGATKVVNIKINGVPSDIKKYLLSKMQVRKNSYFNPIAFKEDLELISELLKDQGFYFSNVSNTREKNIVKYNDDNSKVSINIDIDLDKRLYVNNIIIVGNRKTRSKFILREIFIRKGDTITPKVVNDSQTNLLSSGLFSSVNISPVKNITNKADILISLKEKDHGLFEIAPGIRTDLGPKLSSSVSYNNIDGMNKKITFKGQVNQRFDLSVLDERRRVESNSLLEYSALVNYSENHIFHSNVDFSTSLSKSRRRFFSFDADIQKGSLTGSWDANKWLSFSGTYQLETISQFDSTLDREHGHFQIGSFTPSVIVDLRDNRINPTQGAYFSLSSEFANPTFLSQSNDELVINYYKIISRNRFYARIPNGVLAMSVSAGYQKNLATNKISDGAGGTRTEGYIPNIKVFRLSGMDIVRGFEDDEINRLVTNQDISEVRVDQRAYMANIKFEPRFYLSDSSMIGLFYDAGRVFVGSYDTSELRSSAGISFKYLTPVGSLDFDYGIKLLRKRDDDGNLESPGRLHVSIGFF